MPRQTGRYRLTTTLVGSRSGRSSRIRCPRRIRRWPWMQRPQSSTPTRWPLSPASRWRVRWWHAECDLPPLVRAGLAHVQFETIHPFLDGNGRIGRLLIALLFEHWGLLDQPLLYLSVALRRAQPEYYARLGAVRTGRRLGGLEPVLPGVRRSLPDPHLNGGMSTGKPTLMK